MQLNLSTLDKWIPYKLLDSSREMFCEWLYTGNEQFRAPFFEHTLNNCKRLPENSGNLKTITTIAELFNLAEGVKVDEPAAIIFHISRCGSTIVTQALANNPNHIVLSEVPFFDDLLMMPLNQAYSQQALFKNVVKLYSQQRHGCGNKVFIKMDSWHIMRYKELRAMFSSVPFILLYRNPAEVVRSLNKQPGRHCIPQFISPGFFGIKEEVITVEDFYDYPIKLIEKYLEAYIEIAENDSNAFLFNYNQDMTNVMDEICKVIGVDFTKNDRAQMKERLTYHSKLPGKYFSPEPIVQNITEKFSNVFELYNRLEQLRLPQNITS